jgi:formamidopyrimidine-DNA glycosylase
VTSVSPLKFRCWRAAPLPELPEVETIARGLRPVLEGNRIVRAEVWRPNVVIGPIPRFTRALRGRTIARVSRRAKLLQFELEGGGVWWTSLRMTGHYLLQPGGDRSALPPYARGCFELESGEQLLYVDIRTLGKMGVLPAAQWNARVELLGPEPLDRSFTAEQLAQRLRVTRRRIKEVLLDQRVVAGIGNIYASEALFRAGIHPRARANRLSRPAVRRLHAAIRDVLREALRFKGTTVLNYANADGESGVFQERLRVYDRADESCPRCGRPVRRIVQAQRSTYFCVNCQRSR